MDTNEELIAAACGIVRDAYAQNGLGSTPQLAERRAQAEHGVETLLAQAERVRKALSTSAPDQAGN